MIRQQQRWRWGVWGAMAFTACALLTLGGCGGCNGPTTPQNKVNKNQSDPAEMGRDILTKASEFSAYREALEWFTRALQKTPGTLDKYQPTKADRKVLVKLLGEDAGADVNQLDESALLTRLLEKRFALDSDEIQEIQAGAFRQLDAYHLELCFLLRDATRSMQLQERPPLEQAQRCFDWVCRQITLREDPEQPLQPPWFALKRGYGSAQDRALVFAAMLHQLQLDVAMIALPDGGKYRYWLPGVLVTTKGHSDLYLFDFRLGVPLPGPKGSIATLAQVKSQPELLHRLNLDDNYQYGVTAQQLAPAEVHLICPLSALAPRMRYLEAELAAHDKVRLALAPIALLQRFSEAKVGPVQVWNQRGQGLQRPPVTPTRVLRLNLPQDESSMGPLGMPMGLYLELTQWAPIQQTLFQKELQKMGEVALKTVTLLMGQVIQRFALEPRLALQRGRIDEANKRLERILTILEDFERAQLSEEEFKTKLVEWVEHVRTAALQKSKGVWHEDQYLLALLTANEDVELKEQPKTMLSFLVFRTLGGPLRREVLRLRALRLQEEASRLQGKWERAQLQSKDSAQRQRLMEETENAWYKARGEWTTFTATTPLTSAGLAARVQTLQDALGKVDRNFIENQGRALADFLQRELRQSASATLLLARCQEHLGNSGQAVQELRRLADHLAALQKGQELYVLFAPDKRELGRRLWFPDFEPNHTLHWLAYSARWQQRQLSGKGS